MRTAAHRRLKSLTVAANEGPARSLLVSAPLRSAPLRRAAWQYCKTDDEFKSIPFAVLSADIKLAKEAENYAKLQLVERASVLKEAASHAIPISHIGVIENCDHMRLVLWSLADGFAKSETSSSVMPTQHRCKQ